MSKTNTAGAVAQINAKNHRNRGNVDTPNAHIYDSSFSWLDADISIKSGRTIKLVLWTLK